MATGIENQTSRDSNKLVSAAIDFGTTYCGWAFSFRHEYEGEPTRISFKHWVGESGLSSKAPAAVLVKPDGVTLEAFGYAAEDRYAELVESQEHIYYYYFRSFKMMLYEKEKLTRNVELKDQSGKSLPAMRVFAMVIRYFKEDLRSVWENRLIAFNLDDDEIQWVLTVPAIWSIHAKQLMRESALEAGIKSSNLILALEPEAASIFCKYASVTRHIRSPEETAELSAFKPGARYMVVDAGGGTVDIVSHEVEADGRLKEISVASGGSWGGNCVNKAFEDFLSAFFGDQVMAKFKNENLYDYVCLLRDFEVKKRMHENTHTVRFRVPMSLFYVFREINQKAMTDIIDKDAGLNTKITLQKDKMSIPGDLMKQFFDAPVKSIISHLQNLLKNPSEKDTQSILMVGGFSEAAFLFDAIKAAFPDKKVILPSDGDLAVLKGAVIYGHCHREISSRKSRYYLGISSYKNFDPASHPEDRMIFVDGEKRVAKYLTPLVKKGDEVIPNTTSVSHLGVPLKGQTQFKLEIFAWKNETTMFADEPDCYKVFSQIFDCQDNQGEKIPFKINLILGGTEFEVNVIHQSTGKHTTVMFNLLE